jgi:hypothetical protein
MSVREGAGCWMLAESEKNGWQRILSCCSVPALGFGFYSSSDGVGAIRVVVTL